MSPSKKLVHADNMAFGGTVEEMMIPVLKKLYFCGIIYETV